jgi:hypothetical protein
VDGRTRFSSQNEKNLSPVMRLQPHPGFSRCAMQPRASAASIPSAQSCRAQLVELIKHENKIIKRQQNFTKRPGPASLRQSSHAKMKLKHERSICYMLRSPNQLVRSPTQHREANTCKATGKRAERTAGLAGRGKSGKKRAI